MKDVIGGRYQIRRRLGAGGMASVYLAHDPLLSRDVAIKMPRIDGDGHDDETLQRFQAELRTIGRLNHPNVVTIYDGGEEDGAPYLVMEPVEGESLAELIRREAPLPVQRAVETGRQVAEALSYAHEQGIVHRDVKPQNILLDKTGRAKVTDFGIAKSSELTRTMTGTILGTPSFMAPEVAAGELVTPAADIYGLGVVLYQMLTGHVPFESDNPIAAALRSQREDAAPPSSLAPAPRWLDAIVLRALARDPAARYATAAELAQDLAARRAPGSAGSTQRWQAPAVRARLSNGTWQGGRTRPGDVWSPRRGAAEYENAAQLSAPVSEAAPFRGRRPRIFWILPLILLAVLGLGLAWAVTHAPQQANPTPSPKAPAPRGSPNLLANGALVSTGLQPAGWHLQVFEGREPVRNWRPGGPAQGDREITLESTSSTDSAWISNDVKVEPGWRLTLAGFIQTRGVKDDSAGAALWLVCQGAGGKATGQVTSPAIHGNTAWRQVQAAGTAPAGTSTCSAQLRLGAPGKPASGTAEFSHISLTAS